MRPLLRPEIEIVRVGPEQFVLRDPARGEYFELGSRERYLVACFDGRQTVAAIHQQFAARYGEPPTSRYLEEFIEQLRRAGLVVDADAAVVLAQEPSRVLQPTPGPSLDAALALRSPAPLSSDDPQGGLNHAFDWLTVLFGWMVHPLMVLPVLLLAIGGANVLVRHFDTLAVEAFLFRGEHSLLVLICVWYGMALFCLGIPTAVLKGIACRAHGGRIRAFGPRLYRGMLPYIECDLGEFFFSDESEGRWAALSVAFWLRLASASLALMGWAMATPGTMPSTLCLVLIGPSLFGLLLRANIFASLDGYALLSYWYETPRLYERATDETWAWLTLSPSPEPLTPDERFWFRVYGLGAYAWQCLVFVVLVVAGGWLLTAEMGGLGALIGVALAVGWYHEEIGRTIMSNGVLRWLVRGGGRWYIRWPIRLALLAGIVACGFIPYNHEIGGDARLVPLNEVGIRAVTEGEIAELSLQSGEMVTRNEVVVRLAPRRQQSAVETTRAELEEAEARLKLLEAGHRPEEIDIAENRVAMAERRLEYYSGEESRLRELADTQTISKSELEDAVFERDQAEKMLETAKEELAALTSGARDEEILAAQAEIERLKAQLKYHEEELTLAEIKAPIDGRVITSHVDSRVGQFVQPGDLIAVIQDGSQLRAEIAATESAGVHIVPGQPVKLRLWGTDGDLITGHVTEVSPVAVDAGELGVRRYRTDREGLGQSALHHEPQRYVRVYAELDATQLNLLPEMTGYARIVVEEDLLWRALARPITRFFRVEVWSWLP